MFNQLRARIKRHSRGSEELPEHKVDVDITEPVFIDIDESPEDSGRKQAQGTTESQQPIQGQRHCLIKE